LNMQGNVFGLHLVWRASFGHGWRRKPLTWIMWIIKIWPWYVFYRTSCYARYYECASLKTRSNCWNNKPWMKMGNWLEMGTMKFELVEFIL
jgi:hypothetical protein